jgi:hypothetical protein
MTIEKGLITYLEGQASITAIIGNGDSPETIRAYPMILPQDWTAPAITFQRISANRWRHLAGPAGRNAVRVQIDCYAATYNGAKTLAEAVRGVLDGYTGTMGTFTVGAVSLENDLDGYNADTDIYRIVQDFIFSHVES